MKCGHCLRSIDDGFHSGGTCVCNKCEHYIGVVGGCECSIPHPLGMDEKEFRLMRRRKCYVYSCKSCAKEGQACRKHYTY